jgi:hypothetical protein
MEFSGVTVMKQWVAKPGYMTGEPLYSNLNVFKQNDQPLTHMQKKQREINARPRLAPNELKFGLIPPTRKGSAPFPQQLPTLQLLGHVRLQLVILKPELTVLIPLLSYPFN